MIALRLIIAICVVGRRWAPSPAVFLLLIVIEVEARKVHDLELQRRRAS